MRNNKHKAFFGLLALTLAIQPISTSAEDIDLFVGNRADTGKPNVIIVLDNTSNWARQSQKWPGDEQQGQSEVDAIKAALSKQLNGKINVGLLEFVTAGNANNDGAFVRHQAQLLDGTSWPVLQKKLTDIYSGINSDAEKRNANTPYGNLAYDVYNYLAGLNQNSQGFDSAYPGGVRETLADPKGYTTLYTKFKSPLTNDAVCGNTFVIYVTNPNSSGPATDSSANSQALTKLFNDLGSQPARLSGQTSGTALPLPGFSTSTSADGEEFFVTPTNSFNTVKGEAWNLDDWAQFMYRFGIPYTSTDTVNPGTTRAKVVTYTIDVFNKQQNAEHTSLMLSTAKVGGGRYFAAKNKKAIEDAFDSIFAEILSVSSSFASAALPVTATNRSENENQVFIPMFRPDPLAKPRWTGNLKRYQLGFVDGYLSLVDSKGKEAAHPVTGFIADCAASFWTTGALGGDYWKGDGWDLEGKCSPVTDATRYSDYPDGAFVEKGGISEILRRGNTGNNSTTQTVNRTVLTRSPGNTELKPFDPTNTGLDTKIVNFALGIDPDLTRTPKPRRDIHGDVVHSRPLPINYGDSTGVVVFYGANDGMFRATQIINSNEENETAKELWAFVAPEHYGKLKRQTDNSPLVYYPNQEPPAETGNLPKDYFFDGSTSSIVYYAENTISRAWIYPTMRRGGRMLYGLDVTTPSLPKILWAKGCPRVNNDDGCTDGFSSIGQTWSVPAAALIKGYEEGLKAVVVVGGGYDSCVDADSDKTTCGTTQKGRVVYVLNAADGSILRALTHDKLGSVPSDITLVDVNGDQRADFGYVADTSGNLFRIDFVHPVSLTARNPDDWTLKRIAYTTQSKRSIFHYGPDALSIGAGIYLTLGTGNRERPLEENYPYKDDVQDRFYMFFDEPAFNREAVDLDGEFMKRASATGDAQPASCDSPNIEPGSLYRGWYYDYSFRGEQTVTSSLIHLGTVSFSTSQAGTGASSTDICRRPFGIARSYRLNLFNGSGAWGSNKKCGGDPFVLMAGGGLPPSPVLTTVTIDGKKVSAILGAGEKGVADVEPADPSVRPLLKRTYWGLDINE